MTFADTMKARMAGRGMTAEQIESVFVLVKADPKFVKMFHDWDKPVGEYPEQMLDLLWKLCKAIALKWIDAQYPDAWFRGNFE